MFKIYCHILKVLTLICEFVSQIHTNYWHHIFANSINYIIKVYVNNTFVLTVCCHYVYRKNVNVQL